MGNPECCLKEFFQRGQQGFQPCAFCKGADLNSADITLTHKTLYIYHDLTV